MKFLASHESSTRGTFDFPIELYYVDKMHPRYEMPFHWHMEFELMLVLSGEFSLLIDGRSYLLHKGDAAIKMQALHSTRGNILVLSDRTEPAKAL